MRVRRSTSSCSLRSMYLRTIALSTACLLVVGCGVIGCGDSETAASGTSNVTCGPGTVLVDGACAPEPSLNCGAGTVEQNGECVPENNLNCGPGTMESDGTCVPVDPVDDVTAPTTTPDVPAGEIFDGTSITLTADEPALIYYTTDGSDPGPGSAAAFSPAVVPIGSVREADVTLRYYAVDAAGNTESVREDVYSKFAYLAPLEAFDVAVAGADATITWTAPSVATGVVIAQAAGPLGGGPVHGQTYAVGDTLPGGHTVVYVGTAATHMETGLTPGLAHYVGWAHDAERYSRQRTDFELVDAGAQTGSVAVDTTNNTVTVTTPSELALTATAAYADPTLTLSVTVTNNTSRVVYNPKLVVRNLSAGTLTSDGTIGGEEYVRLAGALVPGASTNADVVVTAAATAAVNADFTIVDSAMLVLPSPHRDGAMPDAGALVDSETMTVAGNAVGDNFPMANTDHLGPGAGFNYYAGALANDGRHLLVGHRNSLHVGLLDLATSTVVMTRTLSSERGMVGSVAIDAANDVVYALATHARHAYDDNSVAEGIDAEVIVYKLDASTLEELSRLTLPLYDPSDYHAMGRHLTFSPDGSQLAVGIVGQDVNGSVHLIDLDSFSEIDINGAADGLGLESPIERPGSLSFNATGTVLYAFGAAHFSETLKIELTNAFATSILPSTSTAHMNGATRGPDGRIFMAGTHTAGVYVFDPTDDSRVAFQTAGSFNAQRLCLDADANVYAGAVNSTRKLDSAGATVATASHSTATGQWCAVTPY